MRTHKMFQEASYFLLLFKDGRFRWNRLENLLVQDREFAAKDALQPVLKLLLVPDGEELRDTTLCKKIFHDL
ncbi:hypothetical protein PVAP13_7NG061417 [Panicum virgatum]|uniref:Uncharacterized protein n=1 Tax=Panicum virgatum TaxID=38727 RepID=A0A8T0PVW4_PANVG|nr:hypothetical protein PVAP13_7NG061417 [Panicum virgatum]